MQACIRIPQQWWPVLLSKYGLLLSVSLIMLLSHAYCVQALVINSWLEHKGVLHGVNILSTVLLTWLKGISTTDKEIKTSHVCFGTHRTWHNMYNMATVSIYVLFLKR